MRTTLPPVWFEAMRLALAMGALVMTVHGANSGDVRIANALEKMNAGVKKQEGTEDL